MDGKLAIKKKMENTPVRSYVDRSNLFVVAIEAKYLYSNDAFIDK